MNAKKSKAAETIGHPRPFAYDRADPDALARALKAGTWDSVAREGDRVEAVKRAGLAPIECGPDVVLIAPARGPVIAAHPLQVIPVGVNDYRTVEAGWCGRANMRQEDVFDRMMDQARRRKADTPFTPRHIGTARDYRHLFEWVQAAGIKCSATFSDGTGGGGQTDFMDTYAREVARLRWVHGRIGTGIAKQVRRVRPSVASLPGGPRRRLITRLEKSQVPFATSVALNQTAYEAVDDIKAEMGMVFDRPTRWTLNAMRVDRSSKTRLVARIHRKDAQRGRHFLEVQSAGGVRPQTGLEKLLVSRLAYGGIIRTVTPTKAARKTVAGNWSPGQRNQVLSGIKAQRDAGTNTTAASKKRNRGRAEYFVPKEGHSLSPGVYKRMARGRITKILNFSDAGASYRRRLDIEKVARRRVQRSFATNFRRALRKATATAR